jgi:hypothetical protein
VLLLVSFIYPLIFQCHAVTGRPKAFLREFSGPILDQRLERFSRDEGADEPTIKRASCPFKRI